MRAAMYAGARDAEGRGARARLPGWRAAEHRADLRTTRVRDDPRHELAQKFADHAAKFGAKFKTGVTVITLRKRDDGMFETHIDSGDLHAAVGDRHGGGTPGEARRSW